MIRIPIIFFLFFFSLLLRLSLISQGPFSGDCLSLVIQAQETLNTKQLHFLFGPGYPLVVLAGAFFIWVGKLFSMEDPVLAVNMMSVVAGSVCVSLYYFVARLMFNEITALTGTFLFSICPIFLGISVYGNPHTVCLSFLLLGIFFLALFGKTGKKRYLICSSLAIGFMGAARIQDMVLMVIPVSVFYYSLSQNQGHNQSPKPSGRLYALNAVCRFFLFWGGAVFVAIGFHLAFLVGGISGSYFDQFHSFFKSGLTDNFRGIISPSLWNSLGIFILNISPVGFALSLFGLWLLSKRDRWILGFILLWIFIPLLFYGNLYMTTPRMLVLAMLPLFMLQGYGFSHLIKVNRLFHGTSLVVLALMIYFSLSSVYPFLLFRHHYALWPHWAQWLDKKTPPEAQIITGDEGIFIGYYAKRALLSRPIGRVSLKENELAAFKDTLEQMLKMNVPVYITEIGLAVYDPQGQFARLMKENYDLIWIGENIAEDWHLDATTQRIERVSLFQIAPKKGRRNDF